MPALGAFTKPSVNDPPHSGQQFVFIRSASFMCANVVLSGAAEPRREQHRVMSFFIHRQQLIASELTNPTTKLKESSVHWIKNYTKKVVFLL